MPQGGPTRAGDVVNSRSSDTASAFGWQVPRSACCRQRCPGRNDSAGRSFQGRTARDDLENRIFQHSIKISLRSTEISPRRRAAKRFGKSGSPDRPTRYARGRRRGPAADARSASRRRARSDRLRRCQRGRRPRPVRCAGMRTAAPRSSACLLRARREWEPQVLSHGVRRRHILNKDHGTARDRGTTTDGPRNGYGPQGHHWTGPRNTGPY